MPNKKIGWYSLIFDEWLKVGSVTELLTSLVQAVGKDLMYAVRDMATSICQLFGMVFGVAMILTMPLWVPFFVVYKLIKEYRALNRYHDKCMNDQISPRHAQYTYHLLKQRYQQTGLEMYRQGQLDSMVAVSDYYSITLVHAKRLLEQDRADKGVD